MDAKSNGFDRVAGVYDFLAQLVLGKAIQESQTFFLNDIPDGSNVLILGGGTGWILESLLAVKPNVKVCYIEPSSRMMALSKQKISTGNIQFITGTEINIPQSSAFDAVITNFYLDLFNNDTLEDVLKTITRNLRPQGVWIATDFIHPKSLWHRFLLKMMYGFFKVVAGIQATTLPHWEISLERHQLSTLRTQLFYSGFIRSKLLRYEPET
jgi:tRNA (cmo5U34)-methyltransferase